MLLPWVIIKNSCFSNIISDNLQLLEEIMKKISILLLFLSINPLKSDDFKVQDPLGINTWDTSGFEGYYPGIQSYEKSPNTEQNAHANYATQNPKPHFLGITSGENKDYEKLYINVLSLNDLENIISHIENYYEEAQAKAAYKGNKTVSEAPKLKSCAYTPLSCITDLHKIKGDVYLVPTECMHSTGCKTMITASEAVDPECVKCICTNFCKEYEHCLEDHKNCMFDCSGCFNQ